MAITLSHYETHTKKKRKISQAKSEFFTTNVDNRFLEFRTSLSPSHSSLFSLKMPQCYENMFYKVLREKFPRIFEIPPFPISLQISNTNTFPVVSQKRQK